jgi:transposase
VAELQSQVEQLRHLLDEQRRGGKRQAVPFAKGPPKPAPKKPGRKPGKDYGTKAHRQPPEQIDESYEAPLPDACPNCGGPLAETHIDNQYQVEIPRRPIHRQFNIHIGCCQRCRRRVQGRHPLQTSDALGAAAAQLGPDAQAAVVELNKQGGMAHGKISRVLNSLFGIRLTRGGSTHVVLRAARRAEPVYASICEAIEQAPWTALDETGWHVGGRNAWLHALVGPDATAFVIDPTRSGDPAKRILGLDYAGVMIHDGWSPYDNFLAAQHQQCLAHLLRRCDELLETATCGAVRFPAPGFWDPRNPLLYRVVVELWQDGQRCAVSRFDLGFRTIEMRSSNVLVNHKPLSLQGMSYLPQSREDATVKRQSGYNLVLAGKGQWHWWVLANPMGFLLLEKVALSTLTPQYISLLSQQPCFFGFVLAKELLDRPLSESERFLRLWQERHVLIGLELDESPPPFLPNGLSFLVCPESMLAALRTIALPKLALQEQVASGKGVSAAAVPGILGWIDQ